MARELVLLPKSKYDALFHDKDEIQLEIDKVKNKNGDTKESTNGDIEKVIQGYTKQIDKKTVNNDKGENYENMMNKTGTEKQNETLKENITPSFDDQEARKSKRNRKSKKMYGGQLFFKSTPEAFIKSLHNKTVKQKWLSFKV